MRSRTLGILCILVVAGALALMSLEFSRGTTVKHIEAAKGDIGSLEGDRQVLAQLHKAGADLSKPTEVNYYLYFRDRHAADSAAAHVGPGPLAATVRRAADDAAWLCFVTGTMVPSEAAIRTYTTRLVQVAHSFDGEYDGWEAAINK